jgi:hypothetical protein
VPRKLAEHLSVKRKRCKRVFPVGTSIGGQFSEQGVAYNSTSEAVDTRVQQISERSYKKQKTAITEGYVCNLRGWNTMSSGG